MPTPTIPAGNLFMNATTYTGTGATQTITNGVAGQSFQPDFVWGKVRSTTEDNILYDSLRGAGYILSSNTTAAEINNVGFNLTSFNSNGFSLASGNQINQSGQTNVAWQWKAGGAAVTNTAGSISSQVSANTTSGFSIVTYTGTGGTGTTTVGHGCQVGGVPTAPSMVIIKRRNGTTDWASYHTGLTSTSYYLVLNSTAAQANYGSTFISPSSSTLTIAADSSLLNTSTGTYVAYCWAPVAGYSAFGSYTGNGLTDGPFLYLGFRPRFIMIKSTGSQDWVILDSSTNPYNVAGNYLRPNSSGAENSGSSPTTSTNQDFLSNGIKFRNDASSSGYTNGSGVTYIYAAFAENPFKYSLAR